MAEFVIQAHPSKEQDVVDGLALLGGVVTRRLRNLSLLANAFICTVSVDASPQELGDIEGVEIVEGEFYHPFYDVSGGPTGPRFFGGRLPNMPVLPNQLFAAALQMLPPALYEDLPTADALSNLLNLSVMDAGALEPFNTSEHPFGAPGLSLGDAMTLKEVVDSVGGVFPSAITPQAELAGTALADIIGTVRLTEAHRYNQGRGGGCCDYRLRRKHPVGSAGKSDSRLFRRRRLRPLGGPPGPRLYGRGHPHGRERLAPMSYPALQG